MRSVTFGASICLGYGSAAPLGLNKCVPIINPGLAPMGYAGVSPLQGSSTFSLSLYYFDVVALPLLVHLSYCVPLLTIQILVSFHNFIKYKSLGSLVINIHSCMEGLKQHGNATFIPELKFVLPVLEAGGSKSDKKTIN